jgi:hypothetical protein
MFCYEILFLLYIIVLPLLDFTNAYYNFELTSRGLKEASRVSLYVHFDINNIIIC